MHLHGITTMPRPYSVQLLRDPAEEAIDTLQSDRNGSKLH